MIDAKIHDGMAGYEDEDQCPECGHVWPLDRQLHFLDCHYHDKIRTCSGNDRTLAAEIDTVSCRENAPQFT